MPCTGASGPSRTSTSGGSRAGQGWAGGTGRWSAATPGCWGTSASRPAATGSASSSKFCSRPRACSWLRADWHGDCETASEEPRFVDHRHGVRRGQGLQRAVAHHVARCVRLPSPAAQDGPLATWAGIAGRFGAHPPRLTPLGPSSQSRRGGRGDCGGRVVAGLKLPRFRGVVGGLGDYDSVSAASTSASWAMGER